MSEKQDRGERPMSQIETVRCLSCGAAYAKPARGGTVRANPGCPECGYVGWVLASSLTRLEPRRFSEDRPRRRSA
jgi:hypothetical protein